MGVAVIFSRRDLFLTSSPKQKILDEFPYHNIIVFSSHAALVPEEEGNERYDTPEIRKKGLTLYIVATE